MNLERAVSGDAVVLGAPGTPARRSRRLAELGLRRGATVVPRHRTAGGGRIVEVGDARVALARSVLVDLPVQDGGGPAAGRRPAGPGPDVVAPVSVDATPSCHTRAPAVAAGARAVVALAGSPNVGKSTLFNALTGARVQMGNWPGTTVEVARGTWRDGHGDGPVTLVDLPGAYSLDPVSPDEALTRALLVDAPPCERPDAVLVAVNAADAARGLYLVTQLREHALRLVVVLTMPDLARRRGTVLDEAALAAALGVPVVTVSPRHRHGLDRLAPALAAVLEHPVPQSVPRPDGDELDVADARFARVEAALAAARRAHPPTGARFGARVDRVVTSPVAGPLVFLAVMWALFQATTAGAAPLVDLLDGLVSGPVRRAAAAGLAAAGLDGTWVAGLVLDGLLAGVGTVLAFVPLMGLVFALLALLEDSGYTARAAVVADRLMRAIGLPGTAFVPLLVGFGCNVPAVSSTRVLADARHRLLTALVVPFTSCSARLPVYVLVAASVFGQDAGTVVFGMYVASVVLVVLGGLVLRRVVVRDVPRDALVIDLPAYQVPLPRMVATVTWTRLAAFLRTATGIVVVTVVAVWALGAAPARSGAGGFGEVAVEDSAFAAVARAAAPVFAPAGFGDWHTAGALVVGVVAKEAVVSSWAQTYAAAEPGDLHAPGHLGDHVLDQLTRSSGGHPRLAGLAFLLFLLGYAPCVATVTAQVREVGLRWTLAGLAVSLSLSWLVAVGVFQAGRLLLTVSA